MDPLADKIIKEKRLQIIADEGRALRDSVSQLAARGMLQSGARIMAVHDIYKKSLSQMVDAVVDAYRDVAVSTGTMVDSGFAAQAKEHFLQVVLQERSRLTSSLNQACQMSQMGSVQQSAQQQLAQTIASLQASGLQRLEIWHETEERRRQNHPSSPIQDIAFISCGQQTDEERALGKAIEGLVRELTPFRPYFAEVQTSFEGLFKNIFGALNRCGGFIAVMHDRGEVTAPSGNLVRASVWIEQEIAIAAFLAQALGRQIHVTAYGQRGIALEGVRQQVLLNPKEFTINQEVLDHLRSILPSWLPQAKQAEGALGVEIKYEKINIRSERHDYRLLVLLSNRGARPVSDFHVDIELPTALLNKDEEIKDVVKERSNAQVTLFRVPAVQGSATIFPEDTTRILSLEYFVDSERYGNRNLMKSIVRATLFVAGQRIVAEKPMSQLNIF